MPDSAEYWPPVADLQIEARHQKKKNDKGKSQLTGLLLIGS